jgi:hypothetical protein
MAPTPYKTVMLLPDARQALESITAMMIGRRGKRVTISEAIIEAERILRDGSDNYPHNPNNYTCPGEGIKCLCWDIEHASSQDRANSNE